MRSKWQIVTATAAMTLAVIGLSVANGSAYDDHEELEKIMKEVNTQNNVLRAAVRTATNYKKAIENTQKAGEKLVELGKKARDNKSAADKEKKPMKEWTDAMDKFIKASEKVAKNGKERADFAVAKKAYSELSKSCSDCHAVFRKDVEEEFEKK